MKRNRFNILLIRLHCIIVTIPVPLLAESSLRSLDSSIKKNTALVKKLKQLTEDTKETVLKEVSELNLSKYISEVVQAICESKLKVADVGAVVQVYEFGDWSCILSTLYSVI